MTAFNAQKFRSQMAAGGARANQFKVTITFPGETTNATMEKFTFMCRAASLPGMTVGPAEAYYFGRRVSWAGDRDFQDWNVRVYNDEDFDVRNAFERWSDRMARLSQNTNTHNDAVDGIYCTKCTVEQLGKDGKVKQTYKFENIWPLDISPIELAWDINNTIEEFDVVFRYDYFETNKITTGTNSAADA